MAGPPDEDGREGGRERGAFDRRTALGGIAGAFHPGSCPGRLPAAA